MSIRKSKASQSPERRIRVLLLLFAVCSVNVLAQEDIEPKFHWAYASFFGTGWYGIGDQKSAFILNVAPRWTFGEASIASDGSRQLGYTLRVPVTIGLAEFDFEDIPGAVDPDNLASLSGGASLDVDVPVTDQFSLKPNVRLGIGTVLGGSERAWTYGAGIRGQYRFEPGRLAWSLVGGIGTFGYRSNRDESDDVSFWSFGAEFAYPISWFPSENDQSLLHWHIGYTDFLNEVEFKVQQGVSEPAANFWQLGVALGRRDNPVRIWFLKFDRLGLAYDASADGKLRGIKFVFRSLYDL